MTAAPTALHGDVLDVLPTLADASIDAVVCDPPYALGFMGHDWDTHTPQGFQAWCQAWAAECLRVLRPGGHLLAFGGTRTVHRLTSGIEDAGFEIRDGIDWLHSEGFPKGAAQLKPAREPIVMARKPLTGSMSANVARHGTGGVNIDACRVPTGEKLVRPSILRTDNDVLGKGLGAGAQAEPGGRWPTNVIMSHAGNDLDGDACADGCVPGCAVAALDEQSGTLKSGGGDRGKTGRSGGLMGTESVRTTAYSRDADTGGASRFYPVFRYQAKAPARERPKVDGVAHPTVKPLDLMRWLVRLVTPPGGHVLDPFAGSGTTVEACLLEGFTVTAVEKHGPYLPLISARVARTTGTPSAS